LRPLPFYYFYQLTKKTETPNIIIVSRNNQVLNALYNNSIAGGKMTGRKTTASVLKAKERKGRRRAERRLAEIEEARSLGISVFELRQRKFEEVQRIRKEAEKRDADERERLSRRYDRYRYDRFGHVYR